MTSQPNQVLHATTRTEKKKQVQQLRDQGIVPCVMYGHSQDNINLSITAKELDTVYQSSGESSLVDLIIDSGKPIQVIIHAVDKDYLNDQLTHADLFAVNMKEAIHSEVPLLFEGVAPAVKELGGVLVKSQDHISIKCLPEHLLSELVVDVSTLATFDDAIHISDLSIPETVEVLDDLTITLATVAAPRSEEELAQLDETVSEDVSQVEGAAEDKTTDKDADKTTDKDADTNSDAINNKDDKKEAPAKK